MLAYAYDRTERCRSSVTGWSWAWQPKQVNSWNVEKLPWQVLQLAACTPDAIGKPLCVCDVVARFDVSQPTISHHLKVLREAGLVSVSRRGVWAYYAADPLGLARLRASLEALGPAARFAAS